MVTDDAASLKNPLLATQQQRQQQQQQQPPQKQRRELESGGSTMQHQPLDPETTSLSQVEMEGSGGSGGVTRAAGGRGLYFQRSNWRLFGLGEYPAPP